mmetsp:Transcript_26954/g.74126  ORF Transcript_26954/g.74126 Transcript_26954/m.74126 type:complete len:259 (-) Transcript_26954:887-1663(-)
MMLPSAASRIAASALPGELRQLLGSAMMMDEKMSLRTLSACGLGRPTRAAAGSRWSTRAMSARVAVSFRSTLLVSADRASVLRRDEREAEEPAVKELRLSESPASLPPRRCRWLRCRLESGVRGPSCRSSASRTAGAPLAGASCSSRSVRSKTSALWLGGASGNAPRLGGVSSRAPRPLVSCPSRAGLRSSGTRRSTRTGRKYRSTSALSCPWTSHGSTELRCTMRKRIQSRFCDSSKLLIMRARSLLDRTPRTACGP